MATTSGFCLNLSSPCPATASKIKATRDVPLQRDEKWRKQCVVGMACMVIGAIQMGDSGAAVAKDMTVTQPLIAVAESSESKVPRWSEKRKCPPWHLNFLETIVPENLPRPSARRRWEAVGDYAKNAPAVKVTVTRISSNCFSM